jgi:hypothetical protein
VSFASSQVGSEPYVEQRLDSRGVLGGLRKSASAIVLHICMISTMLEAQGACCWAREGRYLGASRRKKHREAGWPRGELGPLAKSKTSSSSRLNMCARILDTASTCRQSPRNVTNITAHARQYIGGRNWHRLLRSPGADHRESRTCPRRTPRSLD